jgi:hypothetical protein
LFDTEEVLPMNDEPMSDVAVRAVMAQYGAGEIDAGQAAAAIMPAYLAARAERRLRTTESNQLDPDDASTPTPFMEVDLARMMKIISMQQYNELGDALIRSAQ